MAQGPYPEMMHFYLSHISISRRYDLYWKTHSLKYFLNRAKASLYRKNNDNPNFLEPNSNDRLNLNESVFTNSQFALLFMVLIVVSKAGFKMAYLLNMHGR